MEGLKEWPRDERPNAFILFWSLRIMVGIGLLMTALGFWSLWLRYRDRLFEHRLTLWAAIALGPSGFIAVLAGWITTEVGRQPYTVYGLLTTAESASPLDAPAVATSLLAFVIVYVIVFGAGVFLSAPPHGQAAAHRRNRDREGGTDPCSRCHPGSRGLAEGSRGRSGTVMIDLALIWAFLIAFAVLAYVILDGFDLGLGILFPLLGDDGDRDVAMNSVAPIWDGNETWLVLGGGGLFAVFPLAYAIVMPAPLRPCHRHADLFDFSRCCL